MRKIAFIIQGNNKIGYGHVFRSLKIANQLNKKFVIEFFSINVEPLKFIRKYRSNYIKNINIIINFDYVIIDKLNTSQRLLKNLLVSNKKLILIDDIGNFKSKNIFRFNFLYHKKNIKKNKLVANLNNHTLPFKIIKNKFRKQVRKILILQGSSDPHDNLLNIYKTINKLIDCNKKIKFYFHLGLRNNNDKLLKFFINESKVKSNLFVTFNLTNLRVL